MEITERHRKAAEILAIGGDLKQAAKAGNVSVRQLYNWRCEPDFQREVIKHVSGIFIAEHGAIVKALTARAAKGSVNHIAQYLRLLAMTGILQEGDESEGKPVKLEISFKEKGSSHDRNS